MNLKPLPPYFLIRIPKKEQKERMDKIGSIYIPYNHVFMTRGMQFGEIMAIGADARSQFPEARIGHILLVHHFIEGKQTEDADHGEHLIHEDDRFNYYAVTAASFNGKANETYGVYDGEKIVTHPEFIFLDAEQPPVNDLTPDQFIDKATKKIKSGLIVFKEWKEDRKTIKDRIDFLKNEIEQLCKTKPTPELNKAIEGKEREMAALGKKMNQKKYEQYTVAASNPLINEWFGSEIKTGDKIYCLNIASKTTIEFMGKEYRVVKTTYVGFPHNYLKKAIKSYQKRRLQPA